MQIHRAINHTDLAITRLFFVGKKNTSEIARVMKTPEHKVDNRLALEMDRRFRLGVR